MHAQAITFGLNRITEEQFRDASAAETPTFANLPGLLAKIWLRDPESNTDAGVGAIVAARVMTEVGDVARFAGRNRFASWTGTAPLEASSGEHVRHRLSLPGP